MRARSVLNTEDYVKFSSGFGSLKVARFKVSSADGGRVILRFQRNPQNQVDARLMPELEFIRDRCRRSAISVGVSRVSIEYHPLIPERCWTFLLQSLAEVFPRLTHFHLWRKAPESEDDRLFPVEAFTAFCKNALFLEGFIIVRRPRRLTGRIDLSGDELAFQEWGDVGSCDSQHLRQECPLLDSLSHHDDPRLASKSTTIDGCHDYCPPQV